MNTTADRFLEMRKKISGFRGIFSLPGQYTVLGGETMIIMIRKKRFLRAAGVLTAAVVLGAGIFTASGVLQEKSLNTAADGNWGLSFQEAGKPPVANASMDYLKKFDAYYAEDTDKKELFLTFDAGYENGHTAKILDTLKKHNVKATFFVVGNFIETSPDLVKRMVKEGHLVGNHTFTHPDMSEIATEEAFHQELSKLEDLYEKTTGKKMKKYYRPPQGKYSESNLKMAKEMGYHTIFWSLAYVDWYESDQPTREEALEKMVPRIHPGAIVLLHSTSATNAQVLDELLTQWEEKGYSFKRVDQLP